LSRKSSAVQREITPDIKFGNLVAAKFINCIMKGGKKKHR